jgi:hypothetical protein
MPKRSITALLAALALLVAAPAAFAQKATPTPGGPPADASTAVKAIYTDYRSDGKIDVCDHEQTDLQDALDTIEPEFDTDNPDFRAALEAGIQKYDSGRCDGDATATATATATETATAAPTADDGTLPPPDDSSGGDDSGALPPPDDGTSTPAPEDGTLPPEGGATPEGTPAVPAPVPTVAPAAPAATPAPSATPTVVASSSDGSLLVPGILIGLAILGALALALFPLAARNNPRLDHAWREAAFRTRATWTDFTDWLRLGR